MSKQPVYHLNECGYCLHRHVCKHVDKIDRLIKSGLPLNLEDASCDEFVPDDGIDENWKEHLGEDEINSRSLSNDGEFLDPALLMDNINSAIYQILSGGRRVGAIYISKMTMELIKPVIGTTSDLVSFILSTGDKVSVHIDNDLQVGFFALQII